MEAFEFCQTLGHKTDATISEPRLTKCSEVMLAHMENLANDLRKQAELIDSYVAAGRKLQAKKKRRKR